MMPESNDITKLVGDGSLVVVITGILLYVLKYVRDLVDNFQKRSDEKDTKIQTLVNEHSNKMQVLVSEQTTKTQLMVDKFTDKLESIEQRSQASTDKMAVAVDALSSQLKSQADEMRRLTEEVRRAKS